MRIDLGIRQKTNHAQAGFSLFEVCVGLGIMGIILVSLYAAVSSGFGIVQFERENLRATQILVEKMDTLRLYTWEQLNDSSFIPSTFTATFNPANATNKNIVAVGSSTANGKTIEVIYNGTISITGGPADSSYSNDLKTVTVAVTWKSGNNGMTRTRSFTTYAGKNALQAYVY